MEKLPTLSEEEIEDWTDSRSFRRGEDYHTRGAIFHTRVQGNRLLAECSGTAATPYRVEITLDEEGIASGYCSCPVGAGGDCKHCVALLLTWLDDPESFVSQESVNVSLANRSQEELIALIEQMIERYPDLSTLLEMPIAGISPSTKELDPAVIRHQVGNVIDSMTYDDDWYSGYAGANQLYSVAGQGDDYLEAGEWANAATVYITVAEEVMDNYEEMYDEQGEIVSVVDDSAQGLSACLQETEDVALRGKIVQALFKIYLWDIDQGGIGGGDSAVAALQTQTTDEEKAEVATLLRATLATQKDSSSSQWRAQSLGGFLLQLEAETLSDEEYLRLCRETGRTEDLVRRLLDLDRIDEVVEAMRDAMRDAADYQFLLLDRMIYAAGQTQIAEQLLREYLEHADKRWSGDIYNQLIEWVLARGASAEALPLAQRFLESSGSLDAYQKVREIAQSIGVWEKIRTKIVDRLERQRNFPFLTQIYVDEGLVDNALAALEQSQDRQRNSSYHWMRPNLRMSVARLAEKERPHAAIAIYRAEAINQISGRKRDTYAEAARFLKKVKAIYEGLGEVNGWSELIGQIRQEYRRLPALQDELNKAGL